MRKFSQPECCSERMHASTIGYPVRPATHAANLHRAQASRAPALRALNLKYFFRQVKK